MTITQFTRAFFYYGIKGTYVDPHQYSEGMKYVLVNGILAINITVRLMLPPDRILYKVAGCIGDFHSQV